MAQTAESILFSSIFYQWAETNGEPFSVSTERQLIEEGVATPDLYFLLEGTARVSSWAKTEANEMELAVLVEIHRGQIVGEMSLLEDRLPVANVTANSGSRWIRVNYEHLLAALANDKRLAANVYKVLGAKLALQLNNQNAFIHRWPGNSFEPIRKVLLLFGEWNDLDVAWLARNGTRLDAEPGVNFIQEGMSVDQLFVVLDGEAEVTVNLNGYPSPVGSSRRGEVLGEMSFLTDDDQATATVIAREPIRLLAMPKDRMREQLSNDLAFAERFYRSLAVLLSNRCRDQLIARGIAARATALEELDHGTLSLVSTAGRRFDWLCQEIAYQ